MATNNAINNTGANIVATTLTTTTGWTDFSEFIGLDNIVVTTAGVWTYTRNNIGNYSYALTPGATNARVCLEIKPELRSTTSKGVEITSVDVIYSIATTNLTSHSLIMESTSFINNMGVIVTNIPLTGSLATATQANPYVSNLTVATPGFMNLADSHFSAELLVNNPGTSVYNFYGLQINYTRNY